MMQVRDALRRYSLFALLEPAWLDSWVASGKSLSVALGDVLCQTGTPGQSVYLVQSARVRMLRLSKEGIEVSVGTFVSGDLFGEYALLPPGLNTATCRVSSPGQVFRLPLPPLREAVGALPKVQAYLKGWLRLHALTRYIRTKTFLGFMSAASVLPLLERCETIHFSALDTIQAEGLRDERWFVIQSGQVWIYPSPDERTLRPLVFGPGDCLGETALVQGGTLPLTEALTPTQCLSLRREAFCQPLGGGNLSVLQTYTERPREQPREYPWVAQEQATDCGVAALTMIARFHGRDTSLGSMQQRVHLEQRGSTLLELQQAATAYGFRSRAVRVSARELAEVTLPALAHLADEHYVVVYAIEQDKIVVGDPAKGVVTLDLLTFRQQWTGSLLLLTPPAAQSGNLGSTGPLA